MNKYPDSVVRRLVCTSASAIAMAMCGVKRSPVALCVALAGVGIAPSVRAQPVPPALKSAATVDAALLALGAAKAMPNGRLSLSLPDVAAKGPMTIDARSLVPGTLALVLLRGAPAEWYAKGLPGVKAPSPVASPITVPSMGGSAALAPALQRSGALIEMKWIEAGSPARLTVSVEAGVQRQAYTLLAGTQNAWYIAVRETKAACDPSQGSCLPAAVGRAQP